MSRDFLREIGDFIFIEDAPVKADLILVCGSARTEPALRAAELYSAGFAPFIMPTGRFGQRYRDLREEMARLAENDGRAPADVFAEMEEQAARAGKPGFPATEWAHQRNILLLGGVPEEAILREDQSVNTFENAFFARERLEERGILVRSLLLCCQAFHARRAYQTVKSEFPDADILVCPADTRGITKGNWFASEEGFNKVMDELMKCGRYFCGGEMFRALSGQIPLSRIERHSET